MSGRSSRANSQRDSSALLRMLFEMQSGGGPRTVYNGRNNVQISGASLHTISSLLSSAGQWEVDDDDDDADYVDEDDEDDDWSFSRLGGSSIPEEPLPSVTKAEGTQLLNTGEFGRISSHRASQPTRLARSPAQLSVRPVMVSPRPEAALDAIPNTNGTTVATYDANMYTAQFSDDSSFYYTCAQDYNLHIFDMTKPRRNFGPVAGMYGLRTAMPVRKHIQGAHGGWTITDANLSPDNSRLIYSPMSSTVYMTSTSPEDSSEQIPIPFGDRERGDYTGYYSGSRIWSCRFSADGNEVVAGGDGKIFVYDLLANRRTVKIEAHNDDVNSCCWADKGSCNILVSASDDSFIKVWDRRSLASKKPSGILMGHTEGITYVSAKGDGRYVISNGKDQTLRLWDLRQMRSNKDLESLGKADFGIRGFDYRGASYPLKRRKQHPLDCSLMTYSGHSVLRTLIRCHFSPVESTGQQYIYSGSANGRIHIWSLDGKVVQVLDRSKTLPSSFDPSEPELPELRNSDRPRHGPPVRDVSWHAQEPVLMSAAWNVSGTAIARHEWKGLSKLRGRLEDWVEKNEEEAEERFHQRSPRNRASHATSRAMPGRYVDSNESEEDSDE